MPWSTPTLRQTRELVRGEIISKLGNASFIGNSVLRVVADANAALAHLCLRYIDWLARQLMPDSAETEWLDRHGDIWLVNADQTIGRKAAAAASGTILVTGAEGFVLPSGTEFNGPDQTINYETTEQVTVSPTPGEVALRALAGGANGNLDPGTTVNMVAAISGIDAAATVVELNGGTDQESDDDLRVRVLQRIREPPMGGDRIDYVRWALSYPGVTRAWCYPLEMGMGTVTVRFMMDDLRASNDGFPLEEDVAALAAYLDTVRPVAVKDFFVEAPIPFPINLTITGLYLDAETIRENIAQAIEAMLVERVAPGDTVYASWVSEAISGVAGEAHHELLYVTTPMVAPGYLATLGTVSYGPI